MSAEIKKEIQLEIAHVLFIDIAGYSKLSINEQRAAVDELNEVVRVSEQFQKAEAAARLIKIPTGDGIALVFYTSPEAPAQCAVEISRALKEHPSLPLRMGVHSGPVSGVIDVNGHANLAGAGLNMAQRVMDCGDAGHILVSKHVAEDLEEYDQWRPLLHELGACEVKHGVRVAIANLYADQVGNPQLPKKFQALEKHSARMRWVATTTALLALVAIVAGMAMFSRYRVGSTLAAPEKSIAVLPFESLSDDKNNAYFAEGIQDEILTRLAKIADLKVISRTSTQHYKSAPNNLREIAQQLGVANVLEGSVQKAGDQVRVNVQLINAATDAHLWAESFDRQLTDIFRIESEIANTIAETLQAKLTGSEKVAVSARPTENQEAYQLYLKGRFFWNKRTAIDLRKSIEYFNQAIAQDPNYALAYAALAQAWLLLPAYDGGAPKDCFPQAEAAAKKALALDDNSSDAHAALGMVKQIYDFDLPGAIAEFERAIQLNPNDAMAHHWLSNHSLAAAGQTERAIAEMKRALELDPLSLIINANLGQAYINANRYDEAITQLRKTIEMEGRFYFAHQMLGEALDLKEQIPEAIAEYQKAIALNDDPIPKALLGHLYGRIGRKDEARKILEELRQTREQRYIEAYGLAIVYLGLGDRNETFNWLEQGYRDRDGYYMAVIRIDPVLTSLHGDPRFEALAEKIVPAREFAKAAPPSK
jgi:TolB-like protein/class 3 adenylate cyclase/Flp pilus assembly protein TadD